MILRKKIRFFIFLLTVVLLLLFFLTSWDKKIFADWECQPGDCTPCSGGCCCDLPCGADGDCAGIGCGCWSCGCQDDIEMQCCDDTGHWAALCCVGCFTGETSIDTKSQDTEIQRGTEIKDLKSGDIVSSFNPETGKVSEGKVIYVHQITREGYYTLETKGGKKVKATGEHPFFVVQRESVGDKIPSSNLKDATFIQVKNLKVGDWVFVKGDEGFLPDQITKLDYHQEEIEVFNLSVDGEETFFANDFAVHNKCFREGTEISTQEGQMALIENLQPGEIVSSFDPETGEVSESQVADIHQWSEGGYYVLETESGKQVKVTAEHPFLAVKNETFLARLKDLLFHTLTYQLITALQARLTEVLE